MTTPPATCLVPGCGGWSTKFSGQRFICPRHWRAIPRSLKRRRTKAARALTRRGEITATPEYYVCHSERSYRLMNAIWCRMERAAILGAAGIG